MGRREPGIVGGHHGEVEGLALLMEGLVLLGLLGLSLEGADLPLDLVHHVAHAEEVLPGCVELALRLRALLLVASHPGRFLDEDAALPGLGREHVVEAVLVHERVRFGIDARAREQILHVAETAHALVQQVLALARAVEAARHPDLAPRDVEVSREAAVIVEDEADLGESHRLPRGRAMEDDVFHLVAAEGLGALLSQGPANGIGDIRLAASVGAHDARHARKDLDIGFLSEGLEALDEDVLESHGLRRLRRTY